MTRVLILGGSGFIGKAIMTQMNEYKEFQINATYFKNKISCSCAQYYKLDIDDSDSIQGLLNIVKPQIIISCLRGDFAKQLILHVIIAEYLKQTNGMLYFFSTLNVFDNDLSKPHFEDDVPNSHTDYGQYKIECESRIAEILHENVCILRIPQVWGKTSPE